MTHTTEVPTAAPSDTGFDDAKRLVVRQQRRETAARLKELRRQADGAKARANTAQTRFEKAVALTASDRPEREDWYEHPGTLPRKTLLEAAGLTTMTLHRIMERYRKGVAKGKRPARKPAR